MEEVFHLYSFGDKTPDLFISRNDFIRAVNLIAVLSYLLGVKILAYCLEDTHLHILAEGEVFACTKFKRELQRLIRRWLCPEFEVEMQHVSDTEYMKKVGSYVICQATKDGKHILPTDYIWSTASLYFRRMQNDLLWKTDSDGSIKQIVKMSDISYRKQRDIFHTRSRLPDNWEVCDGMIIPSSFIDIAGFESIYKTHNCFRTFYGSGKSSDIAVMESIVETTGVSMVESEARMVASQTCMKLFGYFDVRRLDVKQRVILGQELRNKFHMSLPQIARRIHLPEAEVRRVIK